MINSIEDVNGQQQKYWRWFLIAFFLQMGALTVRYIFGTALKEHGLNSQPIGIALLVGSIALFVAMLCLGIGLNRLGRRIAADPHLKEALIDDDLIRQHVANSWKVGFIGAVATPFAFLAISAIHPIDDPLLTALATAAVGSGAFLVSYYLKSF